MYSSLPSSRLAPQAHEYRLACVSLPSDVSVRDVFLTVKYSLCIFIFRFSIAAPSPGYLDKFEPHNPWWPYLSVFFFSFDFPKVVISDIRRVLLFLFVDCSSPGWTARWSGVRFPIRCWGKQQHLWNERDKQVQQQVINRLDRLEESTIPRAELRLLPSALPQLYELLGIVTPHAQSFSFHKYGIHIWNTA